MSKRLGLVLGSGIGHTIADIGAVRVLEREKIKPDVVVGTSGGSIVGAFYAAGIPHGEMEEFARGIRWRKFFRLGRPDKGLLASSGLEEELEKLLRGRTFADLEIPLHVVAADLVSGKEVVLNDPKMKVARAVVASSALPIIFQPVHYGEMLLVDGAMFNKLAVDVARRNGAEVVLAISPRRKLVVEAEELDNVFQMANRLTQIVGLQKAIVAEKTADVLVQVESGELSPWDLKAAVRLIDVAEKETIKQLPLLKKRLWLPWWAQAWRKIAPRRVG